MHSLGPRDWLFEIKPAVRAIVPPWSPHTQRSKVAIVHRIEQQLKTKCLKVVQWHTAQRGSAGNAFIIMKGQGTKD